MFEEHDPVYFNTADDDLCLKQFKIEPIWICLQEKLEKNNNHGFSQSNLMWW